MSAIFGILRYDGDAVSSRDLERMSNTLRHRGPDGRDFVADGCFGAGHCLMRVNQEDLLEAQPIYDRAADLTLVADCRIDNREDLARELALSAAELRGLPDSALILRAYAAWGEACVEHLLGDFAFAVWDARAGKLVVGRDHMGQRSVFYHQGEHFFAFATEIKGLWALADTPRQLADEQVARFFHMTLEQKAEGATLYVGISSLPGGTVLVARQDRAIELRRFWEPRADPAHQDRDEDYYVDRYRSVLAEAVACRLRRLTRPAALLMSAGFDTAAIAGLAGPVVEAQGRKLISLSWLGEETTKVTRGDIRPWVEACRRVMPHLDIRELSKAKEDPLCGIERLFLTHEGPGGGNRKTSGYLFAAAAEAGARLVMDGYGGDYTVNPRGFGALARHLRKGQVRRFFAELRPHLRATGQSPWRMLKHEIVLMLLPRAVIRWQRRVRRIGNYAWSTAARRAVEGPYLEALTRRTVAEARARSNGAIPITAMRECIRQTADKIRVGPPALAAPAAARGLELTRPFHDKRVVEFGLAIPEDLYVKNGLNRYLARRALGDVYPPEFQTRDRQNEGALGDAPILDLASPELLDEADRLAGDEKLSAYFDFAQARRILAKPDQVGLTAAEKNTAYRAVLTAKFIEWFGGANVA
jgi:asparagine synthase (glutamine-hydrolysing)